MIDYETTVRTEAMARFDQPQDPLFARINASIGFDRRLWREDIEGSRVHAAGLSAPA